MQTCKVEFIHSTGQKIVLNFNLADNDELSYKPSFEPKITDPKVDLGLAGKLCEMFLTSLVEDLHNKDDRRKES